MTSLLERTVCDRARLARDARFDGRFLSGVRTTRIYCRPTCPVKPARSENVVFFPTAAAAERAGFRPCLRCRPETAPGSPAWQGSAATVSRALTLVNRGFLDEARVEDLAGVLGMGPRHLLRLFMRYVGAPPSAVARTRRVQVAKALLDESRMPIAEIAFAAGFSSVRRFNAAFLDTYGRPPSAIRRRGGDAGGRRGLTIRLAYRPPFDWPAAMRQLAAESTPGVEETGRDGYRRTITLDGRDGWLHVRPVPGRHQVELSVWLSGSGGLRSVIERVRTIFDLDADPRLIGRHLAADPALARRLGRRPALRLPGAWDGFEVAVRRRVVSDVGLTRARDVMERLARSHGGRLEPPLAGGPDRLFPEPAVLARSASTDLGLSRGGAADLRRLAEATRTGAIRFDPASSFETLVGELTRIAKFDTATAHWIAMRTLAEPDATPFGTRLPASSERWRPWRSYVAVLQLRASR
jgi:AraC family transcriptional regulator of adaptative response / DNA-3-methyladenine glycosylase II